MVPVHQKCRSAAPQAAATRSQMLASRQASKPNSAGTLAQHSGQQRRLLEQLQLQAALVAWLWAGQLAVAQGASDGASSGMGPWRVGRATSYGTGSWSINEGSCGYGNIYNDDPLGWNVAALPDVDPTYIDSCGKCLEVQCAPSVVTDSYGGSFDRSAACYDSSSSLVVRIIDTCPCTYPPNAFSNKRWCCGDKAHLELSVWSWERLADLKWGVIGIRFRSVPCDYQPAKVAAPAALPSPAPVMTPGKRLTRDWPEFWPSSIDPSTIYDGMPQPGWSERPASGSTPATTNLTALDANSKGRPLCVNIQPGGAYSLSVPPGSFTGRIAFIFWLYMGDGSQAGTNGPPQRNLHVQVAGPYGACPDVSLVNVQPTGFKPTCAGCTTYWWRFEIFLSLFSGAVVNAPQFFKGCASNDVSILSLLAIRNQQSSIVQACMDHMQLV